MKNTISKFFILTLALLLIACPNIKQPPLRVNPPTIPTIQNSRISLPIEVEISKIQQALWRNINNPVASGKTDEIDIKILATEKITERQLIKVLVKPAQPGYWVTKFKTVQKTVKKAFKCWLNPFNLGNCYKDVLELVKVPYQFWIEPVAAIYKYVSQDITQLIDKAFDISGWVNYKVYIENIDLNIINNDIITKSQIKVDISLDYKQNAFPFGPDIKIKGALTCTIRAEIGINGKVQLGENANLIVDIPENGGTINFTKICIPSAVEAFDLVAKLNPAMNLLKKKLGNILDEKLTEKINEAINENSDNLQFKDEITQSVQKISSPQLISENIWIIPQISNVLYTDIKGQNGKLRFDLGIISKPIVRYTSSMPVSNVDVLSIPINKVESINPKTELLIDAGVSLQDAQEKINESISDFIDADYSNIPYYPGNIEIYASGKRAVISMDLLKRKNGKKKLTVYLWGVPKYDPVNSEIYLDSINFTAKSKSVLVKFLAAIAEDVIVEEIEKSSRWSIQQEKLKILSEIENFEYNNENFEISGGFSVLDISEIFITESDFVFYVVSEGNINLKYDPLGNTKLAENVIEVKDIQNLIFNEIVVSPEGRAFSPAPAKINALVKNNENQEKAKIDKEVVEENILQNLLVNIGDTIYLSDPDVKPFKYRIADENDITLLGDTIYFENKAGELMFHLLTIEELKTIDR